MSTTFTKRTSHPRGKFIRDQNDKLARGWTVAQVKQLSPKPSATTQETSMIVPEITDKHQINSIIDQINRVPWTSCFPIKHTTLGKIDLGVGIIPTGSGIIEIPIGTAEKIINRIGDQQKKGEFANAIKNAKIWRNIDDPIPVSSQLPQLRR